MMILEAGDSPQRTQRSRRKSQCGLLQEHDSAYTGGEKLIGLNDEKMVDIYWLRGHGSGMDCDSAGATAGPIFGYTCSAGPEFIGSRSRTFADAFGTEHNDSRNHAVGYTSYN
jgi:hypothetical protein